MIHSVLILNVPMFKRRMHKLSEQIFKRCSTNRTNPINLDKTLALYFQRPHGAFRIVNEMIERQ